MAAGALAGLEPIGNLLNIASAYAYGDHGGLAQLVEQTAHIRWVIGPSPIAANFCFLKDVCNS